MRRYIGAWVAVLILSLCGGTAEPVSAQPQDLQGPARADIQRYIAQKGLARGLLSAHAFYGDFTGDGVADALAVIYTNIEGAAGNFDITVATFRNEGGRFVHHRDHRDIFGTSPRDVRFSPGRIELTTVMPRPNDPRCCPTGQRRWTIATGTVAAGAAGAPAAAAPAAAARPDAFTGRFTADRTCQEQVTTLQVAPNRMVISLTSDEYTVPVRFTGCEGAVCTVVSTADRRRWSLRLISRDRIAIRGPIYDTGKSDRAELMRCS